MNRLKELRKEKNLLQKDIAEFLKMSQNGYSQYENEITDIPTVVLKKLSNYYNVSIDYILCLTDNKNKYYPSNIVNITNNMNRLSEIRNDLDLKQIEVSEKLPISRPTYSTYETCYCDIPIKILKDLATFYNVSVDYILYATDERKPHR